MKTARKNIIRNYTLNNCSNLPKGRRKRLDKMHPIGMDVSHAFSIKMTRASVRKTRENFENNIFGTPRKYERPRSITCIARCMRFVKIDMVTIFSFSGIPVRVRFTSGHFAISTVDIPYAFPPSLWIFQQYATPSFPSMCNMHKGEQAAMVTLQSERRIIGYRKEFVPTCEKKFGRDIFCHAKRRMEQCCVFFKQINGTISRFCTFLRFLFSTSDIPLT